MCSAGSVTEGPEDAPAVAVATGGDAPSVDEQAAGTAAAAAGGAAVLAGQAEQHAAESKAAAEVATAAAEVTAVAGEHAAAAGEAAEATAADRGQLERFMESQTALNTALVARMSELSAPPPAPEPEPEHKPDRPPAPAHERHWINRRVGRRNT